MIMKVEKEMKYEAPKVEVLKVEVELGFAASGIEGPGIGGDDGHIQEGLSTQNNSLRI